MSNELNRTDSSASVIIHSILGAVWMSNELNQTDSSASLTLYSILGEV